MKLMIATPVLTGNLRVETSAGIASLHQEFKQGFAWVTASNDPYLEQVRDYLACVFMESDCTHLMFIDADIDFEAWQVKMLADAMARQKLSILGGLYPRKQVDFGHIHKLSKSYTPAQVKHAASPVAFWPLEGPQNINLDQPFEVMGLPTGFMMVAREVFEAMASARTYVSMSYPGRTLKEYFKHGWVKEGEIEMKVGEDYYFCSMARKLGFQVHAHPRVLVGHVGTMIYHGCPFCFDGRAVHG